MRWQQWEDWHRTTEEDKNINGHRNEVPTDSDERRIFDHVAGFKKKTIINPSKKTVSEIQKGKNSPMIW